MTLLDIFTMSILVLSLLIIWQALTIKRIERNLDTLTRYMNIKITTKGSVTVVDQIK